jgi:probable nitrogen fixation protein
MTDIEDKPAGLTAPFVRTLVRVVRAEDTFGVWERKSDAAILADFIVTKEQRRQIPIIGDPDPDVLGRVEKFYIAVGLDIERATGRIASPMMKMSHEGFGRVILSVGRLVVISKSLRDVHRFGFESFDKLAEAGEKLVDEARKWIDAYPAVADV